MNKLFTLLAVLFVVFISSNVYAQLNGTYTIPGSYATISAAVTALNTQGVSGPVTFNVAAGHTETSVNITFTNITPSATNTVTFQKSGIGANPRINAGVGTSTTVDAFVKFGGTDYVTFDGIDLLESATNTTSTTRMEFGYAVLKASVTDASQNITIKNCRIGLFSAYTGSNGIYIGNHLTSSTTSLTITAVSGTASNNSFFSNTIDSAYIGIMLNGFNAASPYTLYDQNNDVGIGGGNTINVFGGGASTAYGIYAIYQNNLEIENNNVTGGSHGTLLHTTTLYGIFTSTGTNSNIDLHNNTVTITSNATTSQFTPIFNAMGATGTNNTINITNNTVQNCVFNTNTTSGTLTYITNSAGGFTINISGNTVTNNSTGNGTTSANATITGILNSTSNTTTGAVLNINNNNVNNLTRSQSTAGTGQMMGIQASGGNTTSNLFSNTVNNLTNNTTTSTNAGITFSPTVTTVNIYSNTVNNILRTAGNTTGATYGIIASNSSATCNVYGNTIYDINNTATTTTTSPTYGYYNFGSGTVAENFYNNTIYNISCTGVSSSGVTIGANVASGGSLAKEIYGNLFYNITGNSQTGGLRCDFIGTANVYGNRIYDVVSNSSATTPASYGLLFGTTGTMRNVYNNFIHEIYAPSNNTTLSVLGIWINGGTGTRVYYNSVYLDASSTGTNFHTAALYTSTTPTLDMRNNILINKSTPNGTGFAVAYQRSSTTISTHQSTSDRNNLYAGTPGSSRLIFYDGTNSDQTLTAYKTRVSPSEANSVTENTTFVNTSSSPYDLHLSSCSSNQLESNAGIISTPNITTDFDGNARYNNVGYPQCSTYTATAPDIGADEFDGNQVDATTPSISYTALGNIAPSPNRSFTNVTITDASGINTSGGTKPRVYYKKSTHANTFNNNSPFSDGWKYAEANGGSSPFDFTIDYSILFGGSVSAGDIIQYFVVAQDNASTPNVGINSGTFNATPSSVADYSNIFPLSGTINQYNISALYSGTYTVGTNLGDNFPSLTGAGGLFEALNAGVMSGNITAAITTDITEDGTNDLNQLSYDVTGANYTLRIVPNDASEKLIAGSVAQSLVRFDGNDYVTIDGNNGLDGGGTKYLRFRNSNGSQPTFSFANDSRRNTITNCIIESNNAGTLGTTGTILIGGTTGTQGNDSIFITNCEIRDLSNTTGTPITSVIASGNASVPNDYLTITGCDIYNTFNSATTYVDLYIVQGNDNVTVSGNSIYQTTTRSAVNSASYFAMIFASNGSINLSNNYLGGTAPNCGGTAQTHSDGGGFLGFRLFQTSTGVASTVSGNTIANIDYTTTGTGSGFFFRAIDINGNPTANVNVTDNTVGSLSSNDNIILRYNPGAATGSPIPCAIGFGFNSGVSGYPLGSVTNNTIGGITLTGTGTTSGTAFSFTQIGIGTTVNTAVNVTGNTVGGTTSNSIINSLNNTTGVQMNGISSGAITNTTGVNISNNIVRNLTNNNTSTPTNNVLRGIIHNGSAGFTCSGNTVTNLNTTSGNTSGTSPTSASLVGILTTSTSTNQSITQNTVSSLSNNNTGTGNVHAIGIGINSSSSTGTATRNRVFDVSIPSTTGGSPAIMGINMWFGTWTLANNQVTLTNDEATLDKNGNIQPVQGNKVQHNAPVIQSRGNYSENSFTPVEKLSERNPAVTEGSVPQPINRDSEKQTERGLTNEFDLATTGVLVYGIFDDATTSQNYYYNSVYIGGSQTSGANNSTAYRKSSSSKVMRNNLFFNARTNSGSATGKHYSVISSNATINANYNVYISSNASTICLNNATDQTISQWRTSASGQDNQTWSDVSSNVNASNLFTSISTGNLNINSSNIEAWLVSGKGIALTGQSSDYSGDTRVTAVASGVTDIGADEFSTPGMNPPAATESGVLAGGNTTTYTLWGRTLATIDWGSGGSYPSAITVLYFSGVTPPNAAGGNYASSYTSITPTGVLSGATYDITYYFGDNETYTISTPGTNTVLAKYGSTWEVFPLGTNPWQTQLTYNTSTNTYTAKVTGLDAFSSFALSDGTSPLPVVISEFSVTAVNRDANLKWVTTAEINNKGFAIERRLKLDGGERGNFSQWKEIAFIDGHGTTNEPKTYSFSDKKLNSGTYQYRLKQVDFNGHNEYFTPAQTDVAIGKPGNFELSQNYPNPSNPKSKIDFQMPFDGKVTIKVYDILGQEVKTLVDEFKSADFYTVEFDGSSIASGTYFYRIIAEGNGQKFTKTLKMILVK